MTECTAKFIAANLGSTSGARAVREGGGTGAGGRARGREGSGRARARGEGGTRTDQMPGPIRLWYACQQ